jgi:hypothetical protein
MIAPSRQHRLPVTAPKRVRRERRHVYAAVLWLRKRGHRVYRAGDVHLVDGERFATARLLALAAAEVRASDEKHGG